MDPALKCIIDVRKGSCAWDMFTRLHDTEKWEEQRLNCGCGSEGGGSVDLPIRMPSCNSERKTRKDLYRQQKAGSMGDH